MKAYTDGAVTGNGTENAYGGWAYVIMASESDGWNNNDNDYTYITAKSGYVDKATNQICELMAVIEACKWIEKECSTTPFFPHTIYSDSAYVINCYKQNWWKNWEMNGWRNSKKEPVANKELWEELIPYFQNPSFSFEKVKGHANNEGNNLADELAVKAKQKIFIEDLEEMYFG